MANALIYPIAILAVAAVVYLLAAWVFGRGEELEALPPGATPTRLPPTGVEGSDVRALRFQQAVRGYKVTEVDWVLDRLAGELDDLRGQVAVLERQLDVAAERAGSDQRGATPNATTSEPRAETAPRAETEPRAETAPGEPVGDGERASVRADAYRPEASRQTGATDQVPEAQAEDQPAEQPKREEGDQREGGRADG